MIEKIISGGQVGADVAALKAAKSLGIKTGGWMPLGFRTLDGDKPEYGDEYGMWEHSEHGYSPRTYLNVLESDATVRFAFNFDSPGERCTLKAIRRYSKPNFNVPLFQTICGWEATILPAELAVNLSDLNVKILNVAGNANEGIEVFVYLYLQDVIQIQRSGVH